MGQGIKILAFPSNDFRGQERIIGLQRETFCRVKQPVTCAVFKRVHCFGEHSGPILKFLSDKNLNGRVNVKRLWNFHKFLVNREGEVVDYFDSVTPPQAKRLITKIEKLITA